MSFTPTAPPSSISRLYADAVQCIFAFLPMSEFVAAARCSRQWLAFATSVRSPRQWAVIKSAESYLLNPSDSAPSLRHHIRTLDCTAPVSKLDRFLLFLRSFPQLQRVQVVVAADAMSPALDALSVGEGSLRLPATLLEFRVLIQICPFTDAHTRFLQLIVRLAATAPLLHTFAERNEWAYESPSYADLDFAPLLTLPRLTELVLQFSPSDRQMTVLSNLPAIRRLRFPPPSNFRGSSAVSINSCGQQGGQLPQCEWLEMGTLCTRSNLDALAKVASLTRLPSRFLTDDGLLRLPTLRHALRQFDFEFDRSDDSDEVHSDPIAVLLQCSFLSSLERLSLSCVNSYFQANLDQLASRLPRLRILQLTNASLLSTLAFLRLMPLLEQCSLNNSPSQRELGELAHLLALPRLRRLHYQTAFLGLDVAALQSGLADPSSVYARFDCAVCRIQRRDGSWARLATPQSRCPRRGEFDLNPDKQECWCEL